MTKAKELAILKEAAEKLGPNSVFGPWLTEQLVTMESDLKSDMIYGTTTFSEARRLCAEMLDECSSKIERECSKLAQEKLAQAAEGAKVQGRLREVNYRIDAFKRSISEV